MATERTTGRGGTRCDRTTTAPTPKELAGFETGRSTENCNAPPARGAELDTTGGGLDNPPGCCRITVGEGTEDRTAFGNHDGAGKEETILECRGTAEPQ